MKKVLAMFAISLALVACARPSLSPVQQYAEDLRHLIVTNEREGFSHLKVFPGYSMDEYQLDWVFGDGNAISPIRSLLGSNRVEVTLFGPFEHAADTNGNAYHVLFYDTDVISLDELTAVWGDGDALAGLWGKGFVSTMIVDVDGRMQLYRTPFWYGTHIPGERIDY